MKTIKNKLHSKSGASLLLALLFLGFCVLVGGTVLAAAAANGFRVTRMEAKKQELDDRSAAMLVANQLGNCTLTITTDSTANTVEVEVMEGPMMPMQRLTAEMAVWKFLKENDGKNATVSLINFKYYVADAVAHTVSSRSDFWYQYNLGTSADFTGTVSFGGDSVGKEVTIGMENEYTLTVDLGEDSQFSVLMKGKLKHLEDRDTIQKYEISWKSPQILKEGA